jgi:hypothetical protein
MRLRVTLFCSNCQARLDVHVGPWDIRNVQHECDPGGGSPTGSETFQIEFDPRREVF